MDGKRVISALMLTSKVRRNVADDVCLRDVGTWRISSNDQAAL